jgi:hypothetical protein
MSRELYIINSEYLLHQSTPSRGSSIGRACGSYNSKEINLKVVGSSPTFGYSYIKAHSSSCSFVFWPSVSGERAAAVRYTHDVRGSDGVAF